MTKCKNCGCKTSIEGSNSAITKQVGGKHYKSYKIQPIEFITANNLSFIQGCVVKYICRFNSKNGKEDLDKIIHYCEMQKELLGE